MRRGLQPAFTAANVSRLTQPQQRILTILTSEWKTAAQIASDVGMTAAWAPAAAAKYANQLVRLDLAEKGGSHRQPVWRHSPPFRTLLR